MIPGWLFPIIALVVIIQVAVWARALPSTFRAWAKLKELGLDGRAGKTIRVDRQTVRAVLEADRSRRRTLSLTVPVPAKAIVLLRRETIVDRMFKLLRIARELDLRDPAFDDALYVESDYESFVQDWLASPFARAAILQLFDSGARELRIDKGRLAVRWPVRAIDELTETELNSRARALAALQRGIEKVTRVARDAPVWGWGWRLRRAGAFLLGVPLLIASSVFWFIAHHRYPPVDGHALWLVIQSWLGYAAMVLIAVPALLLRGHYHSHVALRRVLPFTLLAIVPLVAALVTWWNGAYSQGVREVTVAATGKDWRGQSGNPDYVVVSTEFMTSELFGGSRPVTVPIDRARWRDFDPASHAIALRIGAGALGVPWIEWRGLRVVSPDAVQGAPVESVPAEPRITEQPQAEPEAIRRAAKQAIPPPSATVSKAPEWLKAAQEHYRAQRYVDASIYFSSAIEDLRAHNAPAQQLADALWRRASSYANLGPDNDGAVEADCREALTLTPLASGPTMLLEGVLVRNGRLNEALALWNEYVPQRPKDAYALVKRARVLRALGQEAQAGNDARAACRRGEKAGCDF